MKQRAPRNRTLTIDDDERLELKQSVLYRSSDTVECPPVGIAQGAYKDWLDVIGHQSVDLLFLDPPYNLSKVFDGLTFSRQKESKYTAWLESVIGDLKPLLKQTASVYICGDWRTSHSIFEVASRHFMIHNRITWEREKGRGARKNWKNAAEDIWFCTVSKDYYFNVDAVKLRRRVMAPYKDKHGKAKDWNTTDQGKIRDTHPSNVWNDITIPFWSMPENTDHPTQKSEKLLAKILMASTREGDYVLDPFSGSGTTAVAARKLNRRCFGIDISEEYCLWAAKRLKQADFDPSIQGYSDGVFWERNTLSQQHSKPHR